MGKLDEMTRRRWLGIRALGLAAEAEATRSTFHFHASDSMPVHEMKGSLHSRRVDGAGVGRVLKLPRHRGKPPTPPHRRQPIELDRLADVAACPSPTRALPTLPALAGLRRGESATQDPRPKTGPCGLWHSTGVLFPAANFISGPVCPSLLPPWSVVPDAQVPLASPEIPPTLDKSNNGPEELRPHHTPPKASQQDLLRCAAQSTGRRT
ncbi:hypothetical protein CMUS01_02693 [Colletotrichum musicola]|uniref:Uncharacterized protein n=1 Tax=Colletotrichum musicola TaxID=2175873 RepID=A0A8H6NUJ1_9PEZI|nr:hypothetical protein CMUS01_02693 [Colletotrichum musicola]